MIPIPPPFLRLPTTQEKWFAGLSPPPLRPAKPPASPPFPTLSSLPSISAPSFPIPESLSTTRSCIGSFRTPEQPTPAVAREARSISKVSFTITSSAASAVKAPPIGRNTSISSTFIAAAISDGIKAFPASRKSMSTRTTAMPMSVRIQSSPSSMKQVLSLQRHATFGSNATAVTSGSSPSSSKSMKSSSPVVTSMPPGRCIKQSMFQRLSPLRLTPASTAKSFARPNPTPTSALSLQTSTSRTPTASTMLLITSTSQTTST